MWVSAWFTPNALTSITIWPGLGSGSGTSLMTRFSGPPYSLIAIAFIASPFVSCGLSQKIPVWGWGWAPNRGEGRRSDHSVRARGGALEDRSRRALISSVRWALGSKQLEALRVEKLTESR